MIDHNSDDVEMVDERLIWSSLPVPAIIIDGNENR